MQEHLIHNLQPCPQAELEEGLTAGVGELAVWVCRWVATVLLWLDTPVVQFRADDLPLARVVPAVLVRLVVAVWAILSSVATVTSRNADLLLTLALEVARLACTALGLDQHLQHVNCKTCPSR